MFDPKTNLWSIWDEVWDYQNNHLRIKHFRLCDFNENLWEDVRWSIRTVIESTRKRLQLGEHHEHNYFSDQREMFLVMTTMKIWDLTDTWSPIGIWRASLITIVQQMPTVGTNTESGESRPSKWDNDNSMINLCWCCWLVKLKQFSGEISRSKCIISAKLDYHAAIKIWLCVCQW